MTPQFYTLMSWAVCTYLRYQIDNFTVDEEGEWDESSLVAYIPSGMLPAREREGAVPAPVTSSISDAAQSQPLAGRVTEGGAAGATVVLGDSDDLQGLPEELRAFLVPDVEEDGGKTAAGSSVAAGKGVQQQHQSRGRELEEDTVSLSSEEDSARHCEEESTEEKERRIEEMVAVLQSFTTGSASSGAMATIRPDELRRAMAAGGAMGIASAAEVGANIYSTDDTEIANGRFYSETRAFSDDESDTETKPFNATSS